MTTSITATPLISKRLLFKTKNSRIYEPPNDVELYKSFLALLKIFLKL
jgi:hypothetical protein